MPKDSAWYYRARNDAEDAGHCIGDLPGCPRQAVGSPIPGQQVLHRFVVVIVVVVRFLLISILLVLVLVLLLYVAHLMTTSAILFEEDE